MAKNTPKVYRNQVMYSVFVRNYSSEGTFEGVRRDLDRIKALGVDVIWLLPIHPVGEKSRKGTLGSPYAVRDYRAINPEYGALEDFRRLVDGIHQHGMKCIIDVVYDMIPLLRDTDARRKQLAIRCRSIPQSISHGAKQRKRKIFISYINDITSKIYTKFL